jgi:hypothetical protein
LRPFLLTQVADDLLLILGQGQQMHTAFLSLGPVEQGLQLLSLLVAVAGCHAAQPADVIFPGRVTRHSWHRRIG